MPTILLLNSRSKVLLLIVRLNIGHNKEACSDCRHRIHVPVAKVAHLLIMAKTSLQKLEKLRGCAWTQQQCLLLQSYLQAQNLPSGGTVELNRLFKKAVLVTLYCNRMSFVPYKPLDLGIATYVQRIEDEKSPVLLRKPKFETY